MLHLLTRLLWRGRGRDARWTQAAGARTTTEGAIEIKWLRHEDAELVQTNENPEGGGKFLRVEAGTARIDEARAL